MAKLRHIAIVVKDLEKSAAFYETVFEFERVGRDDLEIGSGIYLSDGFINIALIQYSSGKGSGLSDVESFSGIHHFGIQVDDIDEAQARIKAAGGEFFFDLGDDDKEINFEKKFKDPEGNIFDISKAGWTITT